jgi:hypothetical protein
VCKRSEGLAEVPKVVKSSIVGRRQVAKDQEIQELELQEVFQEKT